jgi:hypothetical protein
MDERNFYTESVEMKTAVYQCGKCRRSAEFQVRWLRRSKKKSLPPGAGEIDRAKFAKARDYFVRMDDFVTCPNPSCRARFEIPDSQTIAMM